MIKGLPTYYTIKEVAGHLNVGYAHILNEINRGALSSTKIGSAHRIDHNDLVAYLSSRKTKIKKQIPGDTNKK
jgi:excisionase family DNA binding protein